MCACVGSVLPNGFAQITPRGGTMVYDDEHIALWERGKGSTERQCDGRHEADGLFPQAVSCARRACLPQGGIARFYGTAKIYKPAPSTTRSGAGWCNRKKIATRKKKGYAVLIAVERAEDLW